MKPGEQGIARLISATRYSWLGLQAAFRYEAAFRQELAIAVIGFPLAMWLARSATEFLLLVFPLLLLLVIELGNSAIEAVVDRIGDEHHELSGRAKDMGSAMIFVTIIMALLSWGVLLWDRF